MIFEIYIEKLLDYFYSLNDYSNIFKVIFQK